MKVTTCSKLKPNDIIIGPWSRSPSPIELFWKQHEAAASEKARIYQLFEIAADLTAGGGAAADAACDRAEAAADEAFDALENIGDEILQARATSARDLAIKARVLALRDFGNGFRAEDVSRLCADVQTLAALS
jgi:hypothetical protein